MINQIHISELSQKLKFILESELRQGNLIAETSSGWPNSNSILVILEKPFSKDYQIENVKFRNLDDPHYWKSEYSDDGYGHILACKF